MINTMMMMMIIMTLSGSSLLKAGVKDMGDLATLDSQSIRPIHPNLLHPDDDVAHLSDDDDVAHLWDDDDVAHLSDDDDVAHLSDDDGI